MNKYVRKLFGAVFQNPQTPQVVRGQPQLLLASPEEWRKHWQSQDQPWRTEPEIDAKRQRELTQQRAIIPNIEQGIYPFKGVKLNRADVEWLLATHENGRGPIDWSDESQREREGLDVRGADLRGVDLHSLPLAGLRGGLSSEEWRRATENQCRMAAVHMGGADLRRTHLEWAGFRWAYLEGADFTWANLKDVAFRHAHLEKACLRWTFLNRSVFHGAYLEDVDLRGSHLQGVNFSDVTLSNAENIGPQLADVDWGNINLAVVKWPQVKILGDERKACQKRQGGKKKDKETQFTEYEEAVRANRQLAVVLQGQGLNEEAIRFAYRAQVLQQKVLWKRRNFWRWLGSAMLALLAGYGYRMWRIIVAYLLIVSLCAGAYFVLGMYYKPHLSFLEAILTSVTAFHGRVFSEPFTQPGDPQLWVTAFEAVAGLVIEGVFIAMLTQKFFGK
jgi:uncharacterized protein YjbI with pentapeptide repeats